MVRINIGVRLFMQENFVNILFQKGLVLDEIIKLLHIEKLDMQIPKSAFFTVIGKPEKIEMKLAPLYVLTDNNGKQYFI